MPKIGKSCKACGGNDHCRRSSKKCSQHIPRSNRSIPKQGQHAGHRSQKKSRNEKFVNFTTSHVDDTYGRNNRYFYDKKNDTLWTLVGYNDRVVDLGPIRGYKSYTLQMLIDKYESARSDYVAACNDIDELFRRIDREKEMYYDRERVDWLYAEFYHELRPQKYECSNEISLYYYLIAQSPRTVKSLQTLAIDTISENNIDYASLPNSLQNRIRAGE